MPFGQWVDIFCDAAPRHGWPSPHRSEPFWRDPECARAFALVHAGRGGGAGRQGLAFRGAQVDEACVQRVQAEVRQRVLELFERRGLLSSETVGVMQGWGHSGGFSVHAGRSAG